MRKLPFLLRLTLLIALSGPLSAETVLRFDRIPARQALRYLALAEGRSLRLTLSIPNQLKGRISLNTAPLALPGAAQAIEKAAGLSIKVTSPDLLVAARAARFCHGGPGRR